MTEHPPVERLSEYLDAELGSDERESTETHLRACSSCRDALAELRDIQRDSRSLPKPDPPDSAWDAIRLEVAGDAVDSRRASSAGSYVYPALALAAVVVLGASLWMFRPGAPGTDPEDPEALVGLVTEELRQAEAHYGNAIQGLERIIEQNDAVLAPELNAVLNENLALIERAIVESRNAISSEPESTVAQESLLEALRRKVGLLQSTILIINEVRKGEGESALDLIDQIRRTPDASNPI